MYMADVSWMANGDVVFSIPDFIRFISLVGVVRLISLAPRSLVVLKWKWDARARWLYPIRAS